MHFLMIMQTGKSKIKVLDHLIYGEDSILFADSCFLAVSSYSREWASSLVSRLIILLDQRPTLMTSVNLTYLLRGPTSKYSHTGD